MDFIQGDSVTLGTCTDISESGLRGTFAEDLSPASQGLLTIYHPAYTCQVHAIVDAIRDKEVRIRFSFPSEKERDAITSLIKLLTKHSHR